MRVSQFLTTFIHVRSFSRGPWPRVTTVLLSSITSLAVIWSKWMLRICLLSPAWSVVISHSKGRALMWKSCCVGLHWRILLLLISDSLQLGHRLVLTSLLLFEAAVSKHATSTSFNICSQLRLPTASSRTFRWISHYALFLRLALLRSKLLVLLLSNLRQVLDLVLQESDVFFESVVCCSALVFVLIQIQLPSKLLIFLFEKVHPRGHVTLLHSHRLKFI